MLRCLIVQKASLDSISDEVTDNIDRVLGGINEESGLLKRILERETKNRIKCNDGTDLEVRYVAERRYEGINHARILGLFVGDSYRTNFTEGAIKDKGIHCIPALIYLLDVPDEKHEKLLNTISLGPPPALPIEANDPGFNYLKRLIGQLTQNISSDMQAEMIQFLTRGARTG